MPKLTDRKRFDRLRRIMQWSWADIDRITGRKNARTNISKRIPAWSFLAIEAQEYYESLIECLLIDAVAIRLGKGWELSPLSYGAYTFINVSPRKEAELPWIRLQFEDGRLSLRSNNTRLHELVQSLDPFYEEDVPIEPYEEGYHAQIPVSRDTDVILKRIISRSKRYW